MFRIAASVGLLLAVGSPGLAADAAPEKPTCERWEIGLNVEAPGTCTGILATLPMPMDWPEQRVKIVSEQATPDTVTLRYRTLAEGAKQLLVSIPRLPAGSTASVVVTLDVYKRSLPLPADGSQLTKPARPAAELRPYLGVSPSIETTHPEIKRAAEEAVQGRTTDWEKAEAIYDWVRDKVQYQFDEELKGALTSLRSGQGDCEELTSLFVAFCRVHGIPARSVWIPGHCYPEFYLEASDGRGTWFPCQAAGSREFGTMHEVRPILQKGDKFTVPEERTAKRYVAEYFRAKDAQANPRVEFFRRKVEQ